MKNPARKTVDITVPKGCGKRLSIAQKVAELVEKGANVRLIDLETGTTTQYTQEKENEHELSEPN